MAKMSFVTTSVKIENNVHNTKKMAVDTMTPLFICDAFTGTAGTGSLLCMRKNHRREFRILYLLVADGSWLATAVVVVSLRIAERVARAGELGKPIRSPFTPFTAIFCFLLFFF